MIKRIGSSFFVSPLRMQATAKSNGRRRIFRLTATFYVRWVGNGVSFELRVPRGFETDLASMPMAAQILLGDRNSPGVAEAAVAHDWLCQHRAPRAVANCCFNTIMMVSKVRRWKRVLIVAAVWMFGYQSFWSRLTLRRFRKALRERRTCRK